MRPSQFDIVDITEEVQRYMTHMPMMLHYSPGLMLCTYRLISISGQVRCPEQGVDTGASHPRKGSCCYNCNVSAWIPQRAVFLCSLLLGSLVLSL